MISVFRKSSTFLSFRPKVGYQFAVKHSTYLQVSMPKVRHFTHLDLRSEIRSMSSIQPICKCQCPPLVVCAQTAIFFNGPVSKNEGTYILCLEFGLVSPKRRVYAQSFILAQKSNQNTWFSTTLDFFLVFRLFSAFSPTLCTVVSKKTKLYCFGGFFPLAF